MEPLTTILIRPSPPRRLTVRCVDVISAETTDWKTVRRRSRYTGRGAQLHKWTSLSVKTERYVRCKMVRSDLPTDFECSPGVPVQDNSDLVPDDGPDTSFAANQIAPSCTRRLFDPKQRNSRSEIACFCGGQTQKVLIPNMGAGYSRIRSFFWRFKPRYQQNKSSPIRNRLESFVQ